MTPFLLHRLLCLAREQVQAIEQMDLDLLEHLTEQRQALTPRVEEIPASGMARRLQQEILDVDAELRAVLDRTIRQEERALYELSRPFAGKTDATIAPQG